LKEEIKRIKQVELFVNTFCVQWQVLESDMYVDSFVQCSL